MDFFGALIALMSALLIAPMNSSLIGSVLGNEIWKTVKKEEG